MLKSEAIELLGGTPTEAARAIGITSQAIGQWPEVLSPRIEDRVLAALQRKRAKQRGKRQVKPAEAS